jgi:hypothetical protein
MIKNLPEKIQKKSYSQQMIIIKIFTFYMVLSFLSYMIPSAAGYIASGNKDLWILMTFQWLAVAAIIGLSIYSMKYDKPEIMVIVINIVLLRSYLPFLDIEGRRYSYNSFNLAMFSISNSMAVIIT